MDMINTQNIELLFEEPPLLIKDYDALDLKVGLLRGIYGYGFEKMSEVQQKSLPVIIRGRDIIVQAQSGTGKTATHAIGALQRIDETSQECQVMVLCPTRELAHGIGRLYEMIGEFIGVRTRLVIGGVPMATQHDLQNKGFHVVVGTCGRMLDVINRKFLDISKVRVLVMDELDEMISRGFKEQMLEIMKLLPKQTQTIVCSATIPTEMV
jgi:translation initiation factor 4A